MIFLNTLEKNVSTDIGLQFAILLGSQAFRMGTTLASFSSSGKTPSVNDLLMK